MNLSHNSGNRIIANEQLAEICRYHEKNRVNRDANEKNGTAIDTAAEKTYYWQPEARFPKLVSIETVSRSPL